MFLTVFILLETVSLVHPIADLVVLGFLQMELISLIAQCGSYTLHFLLISGLE